MTGRAGGIVAIGLALAGTAWAQTTDRVSVDSAGVEGNDHSFTTPEIEAAVSADGRYVAFTSHATNLVAGDDNETRDVFVHDRETGATECVSVSSSEELGDGESFDPSISADGRYVAFASHATNLVPGPTNGSYDVYVRDRVDGTTARVSVDTAGVEGNSASFNASISADGRYVAFQSAATNLVAGDTNDVFDAFVHDRQLDTTERVSLTDGEGQGDGESVAPSISADGRYVAFDSLATNLIVEDDTNSARDIFVRDRQAGTTSRASVTSAAGQASGPSSFPTISSDGRYVAFESEASDLVAGDTNSASDVFLRDRQLASTERVSLGTAAAQGNGGSVRCSVSTNGRYVAFASSATNLVAGDTNSGDDVFVRDRQTATTERASVQDDGSQAAAFSADPWISPNGRYVVFTSFGNDLVADDENGAFDVFLRDRGPDPADADGDGIPDEEDACTDTDGDGFGDPGFPNNTCPEDGCPTDPAKSAPGQCGCGVADTDTDGDGTADCNDNCPNDPAKTEPGECGCGVPDTDTDGDGTPDCDDGCPSDPLKIAPGQCGCGVPDTDGDGDGTADCVDNCPCIQNPGQEDLDGEGVGDACDNCVQIENLDQGDCDDDLVGDVCEIADGAPDCNANDVPDACDVQTGWSSDRNQNGVPDECEQDGGTPFCFGNTERICPCANPSAPAEQAGCRNSSGFGGKLVGSGLTSVSADGLVLSGTHIPGSLAVWFQGSGVSSHTFGDGHRCIGGTLIRLGYHNPVAGDTSFPVGADPKISVKGQVPASGGPRYYQLLYRNLHGPCDRGTNITNGVSVVWSP